MLDVGVSRDAATGKIAGDVHPDVAQVAGWLSPNPGGARSRTPPPPGCRSPSAATPTRQTTIHQSAIPVPALTISAPTTRFA